MQRYDITGMSCAACAGHVEKAVATVPGVASVTVSLLTNSMQVDYTPDADPDATAKRILRAVDAALVDYLGMGPVFPTISKLNAPPVLGVEGFSALASQSPLPVVAIGGLDAERARQVRATGTASGIAVVSAICGAENPEAAARALA